MKKQDRLRFITKRCPLCKEGIRSHVSEITYHKHCIDKHIDKYGSFNVPVASRISYDWTLTKLN